MKLTTTSALTLFLTTLTAAHSCGTERLCCTSLDESFGVKCQPSLVPAEEACAGSAMLLCCEEHSVTPKGWTGSNCKNMHHPPLSPTTIPTTLTTSTTTPPIATDGPNVISTCPPNQQRLCCQHITEIAGKGTASYCGEPQPFDHKEACWGTLGAYCCESSSLTPRGYVGSGCIAQGGDAGTTTTTEKSTTTTDGGETTGTVRPTGTVETPEPTTTGEPEETDTPVVVPPKNDTNAGNGTVTPKPTDPAEQDSMASGVMGRVGAWVGVLALGVAVLGM